ncbi:hypothetical protein IFM89_005391 [Coptis chinensis]|uniref:Uncharacterized protein n=1 Tax=Coptis chinensis TaxID=261450 RepID=A0A835ITF7_9MAGN|nr:hypothetical protein IFM89_005391 [Coptis chinensis]
MRAKNSKITLDRNPTPLGALLTELSSKLQSLLDSNYLLVLSDASFYSPRQDAGAGGPLRTQNTSPRRNEPKGFRSHPYSSVVRNEPGGSRSHPYSSVVRTEPGGSRSDPYSSVVCTIGHILESGGFTAGKGGPLLYATTVETGNAEGSTTLPQIGTQNAPHKGGVNQEGYTNSSRSGGTGNASIQYMSSNTKILLNEDKGQTLAPRFGGLRDGHGIPPLNATTLATDYQTELLIRFDLVQMQSGCDPAESPSHEIAFLFRIIRVASSNEDRTMMKTLDCLSSSFSSSSLSVILILAESLPMRSLSFASVIIWVASSNEDRTMMKTLDCLSSSFSSSSWMKDFGLDREDKGGKAAECSTTIAIRIMFGGFFGIGGGMLITPFCLQIGLPPEAESLPMRSLSFASVIIWVASSNEDRTMMKTLDCLSSSFSSSSWMKDFGLDREDKGGKAAECSTTIAIRNSQQWGYR